MIPENPTIHTPKYRGVSRTAPINAAKEAVTVLELAGRLTGLKRSGRGWKGCCPLPNHDDSTPSFHVYPETESFFCFGCLQGGDVVTLARLAWSYDERDVHVAAADLLHEFGHEIPPRPPSWFQKQKRQKPIRDAAYEAKVESAQRRLMHIFAPLAANIEDAAEYDEEIETLWSGCGRMARLMTERAPIHARNMERAS
jgi:DNA primase